MSLPAEEPQDAEKGWFQRKITWLIGAMILFGGALVVFVSMKGGPIPDVGGGLLIEADPDTRIYVGDKLVSTTSFAFSWGELFGDERHSALSNISYSFLIRRANGEVDHVIAIVNDWAPANEPWRRYLLPLRLRKGKGASTVFFSLSGSQSSSSGRSWVHEGLWRTANRNQKNLEILRWHSAEPIRRRNQIQRLVGTGRQEVSKVGGQGAKLARVPRVQRAVGTLASCPKLKCTSEIQVGIERECQSAKPPGPRQSFQEAFPN